MKKSLIALAVMAAGSAMASSRREFDEGNHGHMARAFDGNMAENIVYTLTPAAGLGGQGPMQEVMGRVVFDATAIVAADSVEIDVGFVPRYVCWENITDRIKIEWYQGMAANSCIKTAAAGTRTLEVTGGNGGITVGGTSGTERKFAVLQNATLAAILASKTCTFVARG